MRSPLLMEEELKQQFKKLNQRATALKMDLHDLAENLPTDWEMIPEVAEETYRVHRELAALKKQMGKE